MKYVLILMMILFSNQVVALNCEKQPTCEELNYSKEENPKCDKNGYILCPYDQSYKKCVQYSCEALGFTQSDKSDWCADIAHCKTDNTYTACQSPCFATNYEELSNLAESGKCKIVTMRNDITIPKNQGIKFAPNTILDGGNHTLTSTGDQGYNLYYFADKTGLKNISIVHTQDLLEEFYFADSENRDNQISFENVNIKVTSENASHYGRYLFFKGTYNITGKFVLDDQSANQLSVFSYETYKNFTNADIHISTTYQNSDVFSVGYPVRMENSTADIQSAATVFIGLDSSYFKNTKGTFYSNNNGVIYGDRGLPRLVIQEGCDITLKSDKRLVCCVDDEQKIELSGTAEKPTKLTIIDASRTFRKLSVEAHDLNVTLVINGTTYKPTRIGTTLLSEVENSQNWQSEP